MANQSEVVGKIYIEGTCPDFVYMKLAQYLIGAQGVFEYGYDLVSGWTVSSLVKAFKDNDIVEFWGVGRWSYMTNLKSFHYWSTDQGEGNFDDTQQMLPEEEKISFAEYTKLCLEILDLMREYNLKIIWDFKDFDAGCLMLYEAVVGLVPDIQDNEPTLIPIEYSSIGYDCTIHNYMQLFELSPCDLWDGCLNSFVENITEWYTLTDVQWDQLLDAIVAHPTSYGLQPYAWFETKDELPDELRAFIEGLIYANN